MRAKGPFEPRVKGRFGFWTAGVANTNSSSGDQVTPLTFAGTTRERTFEFHWTARRAAKRAARRANREWRKEARLNAWDRKQKEQERWHKP